LCAATHEDRWCRRGRLQNQHGGDTIGARLIDARPTVTFVALLVL
jgi:hypothetical protein